jgi:hypothetical protein
LFVSAVWPEPSAFITYASAELPAPSRRKPIRVPSGVQCGSTSWNGLFVTRVCEVPSAFIT